MNRPEVVQVPRPSTTGSPASSSCATLKVTPRCARARPPGRRRPSPVQGVVAVPGVELTLEGRALLAQLAAGREAFVSGPTAGALQASGGCRRLSSRSRSSERARSCSADVVPAGANELDRRGARRRVRDDGIRVASPLRMLFGLAGQFNQLRFERAAEDVWHKGLVTPDEAAEYLEAIRRSGRGGVKRMDTLAGEGGARDRAGAERPRARSPRPHRAGRAAGRRAPAPAAADVGRDDPPRHRVAGDPASPSSPGTRGGTVATSASGAIRPAIERAARSAGWCSLRRAGGRATAVAVIRELQAVHRRRVSGVRGALSAPSTVIRIGTGSSR